MINFIRETFQLPTLNRWEYLILAAALATFAPFFMG